MRSPLVLVQVMALVLLLAPGLAAAPPAWVVNQGVDAAAYPLATHLTGFGLSTAKGDEARQRREAVAMAREALASGIRTHITSEFMKQTVLTDAAMSSVARNVVKTRSNLELEGLDQYEYYLDARKGTYYCLAVLDRARMSRHLDGLLAQRARECMELFAKAAAMRDAPGLLRVSRLVRKLEEQRVVYGVVAGAPPPTLPCPSLSEVGRELRAIYAAGTGLDRHLGQAVYDLGMDLPEGIRVLVDRIHYGDTRFSGTLSAYVEQAVSEKLVALGNVQILDKGALREILSTRGPEVDPGEALQSQAVIRGSYLDLGQAVKLTLWATSREGEELASASVQIPAAEIVQAKLTLLPDNYQEARKALEIYDAKVQASTLQIRLAADRGNGGLYRKGDKLFLFLKANLDCYVKIVYHQVDGTRIVIFPNRFHPDARIQKDRLYQVPPDGTAFSFDVVAPFGIELVKVVASTAPLDLGPGETTPEGFTVLQEDLARVLGRTRGIAVSKGAPLYAEDSVVVNTMDRLAP